MSDVPKQTQKLIDLLRRQTEAGKREWDKGSAETEFVFVHDTGSVVVLSIDGDGTAPFELRVLDPAGTLVEKYSSDESGAEDVAALYEVASRSSVKASPVVKAILAELEKPPGAELQKLIDSTVNQVKATPDMPDKVALLKPLLVQRIEDLRSAGTTTVKWPELIAPFPSGGGVHNALTQGFRELRANNQVVCTVEPEPGPSQGFGGGKVIRLGQS